MRNLRILTLVPLIALLACNGESPTLDDPDWANSVLEVSTLTVPPATASGDVSDGTCVVTFGNASATLANKPKSAAALGSPFNDIAMNFVSIHYTWDDATLVTADRTFSIGGTVPIGGSVSVAFGSFALGDFDASMLGHTLNVHMLFHGTAISGEPQEVEAGGTLSIGGACSF